MSNLIVDTWFTDEQEAKPKPPSIVSAGEAAAKEEERLAKRAEHKKRVARSRLKDRERDEIAAAQAAVEERKSEIGIAHAEKARPKHQERAAIEEQQIAALMAKQPHDQKLDARRVELNDELTAMGAALKGEIAAQNRLWNELEAERIEAARESFVFDAEYELLLLSPPAQRLRLEVMTLSTTWANKRHAAALETRDKRGTSVVLEAEIEFSAGEVERCQREAEAFTRELIEA